MANEKFINAMNQKVQNVPPVWLMRQAGRYHWHYQKLKEKYTFMELCKNPDLASEVAMGPVQDFDFDLAILFSDILFPLEGLGMGLEYTDHGPRLGFHLANMDAVRKLKPVADAVEFMNFQREAVKLTREKLPNDKSLIGFVGGPWTLFTYAVAGKHEGNLIQAKKMLGERIEFYNIINKLLIENIKIQLESGAEMVMIFDTAAGELCPMMFADIIVPGIEKIVKSFPGKIGYYTKNTGIHQIGDIQQINYLAGFGIDHKQYLPDFLRSEHPGFIQGNFDQALLFQDKSDFLHSLKKYLEPIKALSPEERKGWVAGLGHGVLPKTPEENVRLFVNHIRETFA